jgi:tRNA nucleotidyltransferase (CCA-adding enzyme)
MTVEGIYAMAHYVVPTTTQIAKLQADVQPLTQLFETYDVAWRIVGGAVRDAVCGVIAREIDVEVIHTDLTRVYAWIQDKFPQALIVGHEKPIIRLRLHDNWVDVSVTETIDRYQAALARDITMNAMMIDANGEFFDPCGGFADMQDGVLRHCSEAFADDPLRVLRLMRFAGQYGFGVAPETAAQAQALRPQAAQLTRERVWIEWQQWALRSRHPRAGLQVLQQCGWLDYYPMLLALVDCPQDPTYHPEGDVWEHTLWVCNAAVGLSVDLDDEQRIIVMLAALCHDLGKPMTTVVNEAGRIVSPGHAEAGDMPTREFLALINAPERYVAPVTALVREHMAGVSGGQPTPRMVRRLAQRLAPATIDLWGRITGADGGGRPPLPAVNSGSACVALAQSLGVVMGKPTALVRGGDIMQLGVPQGPQIGEWLQRAYDAQLDGMFTTREQALAWLQETWYTAI